MMTVKERMVDIIQSQPDDSSYEQLLHELAFEWMVERGVADYRAGRTLSDKDVKERLESWAG